MFKNFFQRLEEVLEIRLSQPPDRIDVVVGLGFGLSPDGTEPSPQGKAIAVKVTEEAQKRNAPILFTGGFFRNCQLANVRQCRSNHSDYEKEWLEISIDRVSAMARASRSRHFWSALAQPEFKIFYSQSPFWLWKKLSNAN
jgi:hypothetical protein